MIILLFDLYIVIRLRNPCENIKDKISRKLSLSRPVFKAI